jgi:hypothetical protein
LFADGVVGAFSFPAAAPLAVLTRPLSVPELRKAANSIARNTAGKITPSDKPLRVPLPTPADNTDIYGPSLEIATPTLPPDALASPLSAVVFGACVTKRDAATPTLPRNVVLPFSVAYCANVAMWALSTAPLSYEWIIGRPVWFKAGT